MSPSMICGDNPAIMGKALHTGSKCRPFKMSERKSDILVAVHVVFMIDSAKIRALPND